MKGEINTFATFFQGNNICFSPWFANRKPKLLTRNYMHFMQTSKYIYLNQQMVY